MIRRLPSRNQRSKSIKVKNVLQICLLLGVCFWLIYQIKHSHDKKKEFDEHDAKISIKEQIVDKTLRIGRKELHPRVEKITTKYEKRGEEMDEETDKEHLESNHEDEFREEDKDKHEDVEQEEEEEEEIESVGIGDGDDIDSHEQQKVLQDFVDDGIENEDEDEEKETEENKGEDREHQVEDEHLTENQDGDRIIHEALDEHYKADDASSEVAHDTHAIITETEKLRSEDSNVNIEINTLKEDNKLTNTEETGRDKKSIEVGENQEVENGTTLDVKFGEQKDQEDNSTIITSGVKVEASNNTSSDSILNQNGTVRSTNEDISNPPNNELEQTKNNNITEHGQFDSNSTIPIDGDRFDSNSTIPNETKNTTGFPGETLNFSNQTANVSEKTIWSDNTGELDSSGYIRISEHADAAAQNGKSENDNKSGESDESSGTFNSNENYDTVLLHDPLDENDIDLDALPDIKTGGTSNGAVAED